MSLDVVIVMPVYNEAEIIEPLIAAWIKTLDELKISWRLLAYDDGSRDDSLARLRKIAELEPRVLVRHHTNRGHGPTVIKAYREAATADWVFQVDSDDEIPAEAFESLWQRREGCDLLIGERMYNSRPFIRRLVSYVSRQLVNVLFGRGVQDVNAPYRLMRGKAFRKLFEAMPDDLLSPNVIITGAALRWGLRVCCVPVPYRFRRTGVVAMRRGRLLRTALLSFGQTFYVRFVIIPRL